MDATLHGAYCVVCGAQRIMCLASGGDGKISTLENATYSGPEKCWKFLNILITSLAQNMLGIVYIF